MLHGYKKSRYNIYDNLEFLGLNLYEQKHFCFGEGSGGSGGSGGDGPGGDAPSGEFGGGIPGGDPDKDEDDETDLASADPSRGPAPADPTMGLGDFADVLGLPDVPMGPMANIDSYHEGYYDADTGKTKSDKQYAMDILNELNQKGMKQTAQDMLNARAFQGLGIPEMNALEKQGLKTWSGL